MSDTSTPASGTFDSGKPVAGKPAASKQKPKKKKKDGPGLFARIRLFLREVVAELRKVIWPTRKELTTYTWIVIVFVLIMAGIVAALDFVFTKGVLAVFGD